MATRTRAQFVSNAGKLAARQRTRAAAVDMAMKAAAKGWAEATRQRAIRLSQGTLTAKELARHRPGLYSTQLPASPLFDVIVNKRSGEFANGWRIGTWSYTGLVTATVYNNSAHSGFMDGTVKTRRRAILEAAVYGWPGNPYSAADYDRVMQEAHLSASSAPSESASVGRTGETTFTKAMRRAKRGAEASVRGDSSVGSVFIADLVQITATLSAAYGSEFF